ncbi:hypothetical protein P43SY_008081 [Pythium insidiosum]|uniref:Myb/SANT-like domain-containing protein n=1 Tax=Pythium insidiosum TaxID=114742 RepID=A0AAD5LDJ3_PYTIN|nr:hypothetical protein P43SY_008081 [Pythium insidiosum]
MGGTRYSWAAPEKTRLLIALVTEALAHKSDAARYITSREWDAIAEAFNRAAPEPVDNVKALHNRLAILRAQCREFHGVVLAARQQPGGELTDAAWDALELQRPALRKWRAQRFEFYDDMAACLQLFGSAEELGGDAPAPAAGSQSGSAAASDAGAQLQTPPSHGEDDNADDGENRAMEHEHSTVPIRPDAMSCVTPPPPPPPAVHKRQVLLARHRLPRDSPRVSPYSPSRRLTRAVDARPPPTRHRDTATRSLLYEDALTLVPRLGLSIEDRIDVKRFLVDERNARVFLHLDDDERRLYVQKYCLDRRDDARCYRFEPA